MKKKYGNTSKQFETSRARSSVGRAPQWHHAAPPKNSRKKLNLTFPDHVEVIEIPEGWQPVPAMREVNGHSSLFHVLVRKTPKRLENDLKAPKRRKSA